MLYLDHLLSATCFTTAFGSARFLPTALYSNLLDSLLHSSRSLTSPTGLFGYVCSSCLTQWQHSYLLVRSRFIPQTNYWSVYFCLMHSILVDYALMYYLDCSYNTLSIIDLKINDHSGNIINMHLIQVSLSSIFVKVVDEWDCAYSRYIISHSTHIDMSGSAKAPPPSQYAPLATLQIEDNCKLERKPRELKEPKQPKDPKQKSRVIAVSVNPTEYVDDQKPPSPPPDEQPNEPSLLALPNEPSPPELPNEPSLPELPNESSPLDAGVLTLRLDLEL